MTIRTAPFTFIAVLLLAACSAPHTTAVVDPTPTPQGPYVALGDSYTAAPKVPSQTGTPSGCERSTANYPALVAQRMKIRASLVHDVSCGGATIADLSASQSTGSGTNPAQLNALTTDTALVTVGIGGNDVDFAGILSHCVDPALLPTADGVDCATTLGITPADVSFLSNEELQLNDILKQRATAAGDTYVDTYTPSIGHDACSDAATRWIEPLLPAASAAPMHPNAVGERGMAAAVERALAQ